ncbi:MAG: DUF4864 domain-containing protein [Gammaproteobacteria bacterium]|nr:DUF4864 domain-containing protein [Gammaproteobacteria bacterium]MBU1653670.1 DUF4864 domain-containing protein [Gammaproteobacteria bacterium]MBU1962500.1 DUF4864 domain-containing protein [Gammaproteobacteria bacterium]
MFCPKCGTQIPESAHFCPSCGIRADGSAPVAPDSLPPVQRGQQTQPVTKKKMATWKKVLLWIGGFIIFVIGLAMFVTGDLQATVDSHLASLRSGDIESAYGQTSPEFKQATSLDAYKKFVETYPVLTKHSAFSFDSRGFENNRGQVMGHLTDGSNKLAKIEFQMVKIEDKWMIQGIDLKASDK